MPPLAPLRSGGMITSGAIVTTLTSSLTKVFSETRFMACGTPSKLKVELELSYRESALLAMAQLGWLGINVL